MREPNLAEADWWSLSQMDCGGPLPCKATLKRLYVEGLIILSKQHGPGLSKRGQDWALWYRRSKAQEVSNRLQGVNT